MGIFKKKQKSENEIFLEKILTVIENSLSTIGLDLPKNKDNIRKKMKNHEITTISDLKNELNLASEDLYFRLNPKIWSEFKSPILNVEKTLKMNMVREYGTQFKEFLFKYPELFRRCLYKGLRLNLRHIYSNIICKVEISLSIKRVTASVNLGQVKELNSKLNSSVENLIVKFYNLYLQDKKRFNKIYTEFSSESFYNIEDTFNPTFKNPLDITTTAFIEFVYLDGDVENNAELINTKLDKKDIRRLRRLQRLIEEKTKSGTTKFSYVESPMYGMLLDSEKGKYILNFNYLYHINSKKILFKKPQDMSFSDWSRKILKFVGIDYSNSYFSEIFQLLNKSYNCRTSVIDSKGRKL